MAVDMKEMKKERGNINRRGSPLPYNKLDRSLGNATNQFDLKDESSGC